VSRDVGQRRGRASDGTLRDVREGDGAAGGGRSSVRLWASVFAGRLLPMGVSGKGEELEGAVGGKGLPCGVLGCKGEI